MPLFCITKTHERCSYCSFIYSSFLSLFSSDELRDAGFPAIEPEHLCVPEEEFVMSYMLTQIEMELSLKNDYDSITEATKNMVMELQAGIKDFDETEKRVRSVVQMHFAV